MAEGRYILDEKISLLRAEGACTVMRAERGACTAETGTATMVGGGMLNAVVQEQLLRDGGSVSSTVESPGWCNASAVCKSSMLCCCSTAVANSPCMRVAPILQVVDQRVLSARKKRCDPKFVA